MRGLAWILLLTLTSLSAAAAPVIDAQARVEPPYVIITLALKDLPASTLTFDIGNFSRYMEYAFAITGGDVAHGYLNGSRLIFPVASKAKDHTVYLVLKTFGYEFYSATFSLPAPLAPIEVLPCNYSLMVYDLPSMPTVLQSLFNVTTGYNESLRYYIKGSTLAEEPVANLTFRFTGRLSPSIKSVERTVILDAQRVTIIDNITLEGVTEYVSDSVSLTYPLNLEVEGVGGLLGPYPSTLYSVTRTPNSTRIDVKLLAPPQRRGDLAQIWVRLSSPLSMQNNRYMIPAFVNVGYYVQNLTVTLRVLGELAGLKEGSLEGDYRVYRLPGRKLLGVEVDPYIMLEGHLQPPKQLNYPLLAVVFAAVAALGYIGYFALARGARVPSTEAVTEVSLASELTEILRERVENLTAFRDSWNRYISGKLSKQAYRQAALKYRRREAELRKRARDTVSKGEEVKLLDKIDNLFLEVDKIINRFEELKTSIEKGFITEKDGRKGMTELEEKLRQIEEELEDLITRYS